MKPHKLLLIAFSIISLISCQSENAGENIENTLDEELSIVSAGIQLNVTSCGQGNPSILFIHGWCINESYWDDQKEAFCGKYNIITLDLPGFGKSIGARDSWSIENYSNDVITLIDQLNLTRVILVGHSMGGDVMLETAIKRPTKVVALIGIDNFKDVGVEYSEQDHEDMVGFMAMLKEDFANIGPAYAQGMLFHASTDSLIVQRVMTDIGESNPEVAVSSLQYLFDYVDTERSRLSELKQKLYLINSDATPTNIEGLDATGVTYDVEYIHATGHYPMVEKPKEFNKLLQKILDKIR